MLLGKHLYVMGYINGMSHGWQSFDITPNAACEVKAYDVGRDTDRIFIAVASRSTTTAIQHTCFSLSILSGGKDNIESNPFSGKHDRWDGNSVLIIVRDILGLDREEHFQLQGFHSRLRPLQKRLL